MIKILALLAVYCHRIYDTPFSVSYINTHSVLLMFLWAGEVVFWPGVWPAGGTSGDWTAAWSWLRCLGFAPYSLILQPIPPGLVMCLESKTAKGRTYSVWGVEGWAGSLSFSCVPLTEESHEDNPGSRLLEKRQNHIGTHERVEDYGYFCNQFTIFGCG